MIETYYPAHASLPVDQLLVVGPTAWVPSAELVQQMLAELKAAIASKRRAP